MPHRRHRVYRSALFLGLAALAASGCSGSTDGPPANSEQDMLMADGDTDTTSGTDATSSDDTPTDTPTTQCTAPMSECDGDPATVCETDTSSSTRHCGTCGNTCGSTEVCSNGVCRTDCEGTLNCGGSCVDPARSREHCGGCDQACEEHEVCIDSRCEECSGADLRCGNMCISQSEDNCGACGNVCPMADNATVTCTKGECDYFCNDGFGDCDDDLSNGCEAPIDTDQHCGACGQSCGAVPNGTSTCSERACVVDSCDAGWFDVDGDIANGCEFGFQHLPGLSGHPTAVETTNPHFALSRSGSTTYMYSLAYNSSEITRSNLGGSGATTFASGLPNVTGLAATDGGVGFAVSNNRMLRPFTGTVSRDYIEPIEYTTGLGVAMAMKAFKPIGANYTAGLILGSYTSLDWFAFAENVSSGIYYGANATIPTNCSYFVDVYSVCRVVSRPMHVRALDVFEHEGQQYVLVFFRTGSSSPFTLAAELYRIDHPSRQLILVAQPAETGLPGINTTHLSVLPASGSTPPGFVLSAAGEVLVGRFNSMDLRSWSDEARLTVPQGVSGVVALDSKHILLTSFGSSAQGGSVLVTQTSPAAPASRIVEVASYDSGTGVSSPMLDPGVASHVLMRAASSVQAYRWQLAP